MAIKSNTVDQGDGVPSQANLVAEDVLLNVSQTAGLLSLSPQTIRQMVARGELAAAMRTPRGQLRFWLSEVFAYRDSTLNVGKGQVSGKPDGRKKKSRQLLQADGEVSQP